jgi:hypothetical protein
VVRRPAGPGPVLASLGRAFDDARFGPARTLDLRMSLPTVAEALRRTEPWLRERQMARAGEVLVITGRGRGSPGGHGVVRAAVKNLLVKLKRSGVVSDANEQNPGAFAVTLAPIRALFETVPRSRARREDAREARVQPAALAALDPATLKELRALAEYSLDQLGAKAVQAFVDDEMTRQFTILSRGIAPDETDREGRLRFLISAAKSAFEDDA